MHLSSKATLATILFLVSSCSTNNISQTFSKLTLETEEEKIEKEFPQEDSFSESIENEEIAKIKNPENFIKFYLRSKFSLYNSNSLSEISLNNYKLALEHPESFETQEQAFILLLADQKYAKALNIQANKVDTQKMTFENLFLYSQAIAQNNIPKAKEYLNELLSTQNRLPHLKIIKSYFKYEETNDIEVLKKEILAINSSTALDGFKHYYIGRAYESIENYEEAFKFYSSAFFINTLRTADVFKRLVYSAQQIDEDNTQRLFKSNSKYGKNIYLIDQAFIDLTKLTKLDNSLKAVSAQALYDLGWSINQTSSNLAGLNFLALSDYVKPSDKAKVQLAKGYYNNTWKTNTIELLESINNDSQEYISANIILADVLKEDQPLKAIEVIKGLKNIDQLNKNYLDAIIGQIYLNNDNFKEAIVYLTKALESDKSSKIYFSRAVAYERTSQFDNAISDLNTALNKNPKNPIILNYLGYLLIDLNKEIDLGLDYIKRSIELDPINAASLDSLGWAYIKLKDYDKALSALEKAYSITSDDGVITGHLGDAYLHNNRKKEAIIYWKKALELEKKDLREIERIKNQLYKYNN